MVSCQYGSSHEYLDNVLMDLITNQLISQDRAITLNARRIEKINNHLEGEWVLEQFHNSEIKLNHPNLYITACPQGIPCQVFCIQKSLVNHVMQFFSK